MKWLRRLLQAHTVRDRKPGESADSLAAGLEKAKGGLWADAAERFRDAVHYDPLSAEAHHNLSIALSHTGDFEGAFSSAQSATELMEKSTALLLNLGNTALRVDHTRTAEAAYRKVLDLNPSNASAHSNLGILYCHQKSWAPAVEHLNRAVDAGPPNVSVLIPLAVALRNSGRLRAAEATIEQALSIYPTSIEGLLERAHIYHAKGIWADTEAAAQKVIAQDRNNTEGLYLLAHALQKMNKVPESLRTLETILSIQSNHFSAITLMADILRKSDQTSRAHDILCGFRDSNPNDAGGHFLLGVHFHELADYVEALKHYEKAHNISPGHSEALRVLGRVQYELRQYKEARTYLEKSLASNPRNASTIRYLAELELTTGHLDIGWDLLSDRRCLSVRPILYWVEEDKSNFSIPLAGKNVLIMREQGLGDEIRWSSCYRDVIDESEHCIIQCDKTIASIFARSFPEAEIFPVEALNSQKNLPQQETYEVLCLSGDLTARFRRKISDFPERDSYLKPDPQKADLWKNRLDTLGDDFKVGICWRSELVDWYRMRNAFYTHLDEWGDILKTPGATFINLHYGDSAHELEQAEKNFGVHIHEWPDLDLKDDLDSVFALVSQLDLVITVQTAVWNMAGAVGTETLAILNPIMRLGTDHIPWYNSVMPVQQDLGDSPEVVLGRIAAELKARIAARR